MRHTVLIHQKSNSILSLSIEGSDPYQLVEGARFQINTAEKLPSSYADKLSISTVMPIHNLSGIRDFRQITQMKQKIEQGDEIVEPDGIPNVKLISTPTGKLLLFDGTHSLLAYFYAGRQRLGEIPYLLISSENGPAVTEEEIAYFFPRETREKVLADWEKYVVNWQAPSGEQLEERQVMTIGELADQLREADKSAVEK